MALQENLTQKLPAFLAQNFKGYEHFIDKTVLDFNKLTYPSINCTVPSFDRIVPDLGKTLLGDIFDVDIGINGNKQKFKNMGGIEMEIRSTPNVSPTLRDIIEIIYQNDTMILSTVIGVFQVGETVRGVTSGATAIITNILGSVLTLSNITGTFIVGENIIGQSSGATAQLETSPGIVTHQITENTNPIPVGPHEFYFDEWFDTNLTAGFSLNMPRAIWVNGYVRTDKKGEVYSWTGGVAQIISIVPNVSITIASNTTWASLGFVNPVSNAVLNYNTLVGGPFTIGEIVTGGSSGATGEIVIDANNSLQLQNVVGGPFDVGEVITGGTSAATANVAIYFGPISNGSSGNIVVNGVTYTVTSGWETNTLLLANTVGINIGDIATSQIEVDISPIPFDSCRQVKGYMYYGNWNSRDYYQSNAFNRRYNYLLTNFQAVQNDLVFNSASEYTGTVESVFHIVIDSVSIDEQTFTGNGTGNGFYTTSGYTGTSEHTYKFVFVADMTLNFVGATMYDFGTYIIGATPNDVAIVVWGFTGGAAVQHISGTFNEGDAVTGTVAGTSGVAEVIAVGGAIWENWWFFYKDGVLAFQLPGVPTNLIAPTNIALGDGLFIEFNTLSGIVINDTYTLVISPPEDTFQWQQDGGTLSASIPITGNFQALNEGLEIKFVNKTGHTLGDFWDITAYPSLTRAWDNFYYALSRKVGEGYKYRLPSNFWTHDTQEDVMYVNCSYGEWNFVSTEISSDALSERVVLTPLKQSGANKVLYPYLTGHVDNDLVFITIDKNLNTIGRQQFLEKPQVGYLSDPVKLDFDASSFVGGRIKFFNEKLYISSPEDGIMHCYDTFKKYWQAPKVFPEMGILSIFGNNVICHSNIRNQSFTLFTNTDGDNGQPYVVRVRSPYYDAGTRWQSKKSSMSFTEGYITGDPMIRHTVFLDVNGCKGIQYHDLDPIVCISPDRSPIGAGPLGSHPLGSDIFSQGNYFQEIWTKYKPLLNYYFISIQLECTAKTHSYSFLSYGMNGCLSTDGNNDLVPKSEIE